MIFAIEHRLGASLIEAKTEQSAIRKARRYFGERAEPIVVPKDQQYHIARCKEFGAGVIMCVVLCVTVFIGTSHAAEICTDRDEFIHFAQRYQLLEKRDKTQSESIKALMEKDKAWQQYKASAEPLLAEYASRLEESIKREEALTARNEYLEARDAEQKKMEWIEKAEVAGTAVAVALTARWGGKHLWRIGRKLLSK